MKNIIIPKPETLISNLENLYQQNKTYIFRGQPSSDFFLVPNAFRQDGIKKLSQEFSHYSYQEWCDSEKVKKLVSLYLNSEFINNLYVRRIYELTFYTMQYNYHLAKYVQQNQKKFDHATLKMYELRPPKFWKEKETFIYLFQYGLNLSIGRIDLEGKILNYSTIDETLAGYDDSLPQHYGVPTAALDWTSNPYIAIYFALEDIPPNTSHIAVYAYREIFNTKKNPLLIAHGHPECENLRIARQEGIFTRFQYACFYYFIHGIWPSIETYTPLSSGIFELIKYHVPVCYVEYLRDLINQRGINREYLFPDEELIM